MMWRRTFCSLLAPALFAAHLVQQPDAAAINPDASSSKPGKPQFFAGLVIEADANHVKVSRNLVGRTPETHVFAINNKTKTPKGGVKLKTRVTVRYEHMPEQDMALEIQVRPFSHTQKTS